MRFFFLKLIDSFFFFEILRFFFEISRFFFNFQIPLKFSDFFEISRFFWNFQIVLKFSDFFWNFKIFLKFPDFFEILEFFWRFVSLKKTISFNFFKLNLFFFLELFYIDNFQIFLKICQFKKKQFLSIFSNWICFFSGIILYTR